MAFVSLLSLVTKKFSFHPFLEVRNLAPNKLRKETMLRSSVDKPLHRNKCDFGPSGSQINDPLKQILNARAQREARKKMSIGIQVQLLFLNKIITLDFSF